MRHCLVTGASGFIGRALCRRLQAGGDQVRALLRRPAEGPWEDFVLGDLASDDLPGKATEDIDTVFHLAGRVHAEAERAGEEDEYRRVNVEGTRNLLELAARTGARAFVLASSVKAMGEEHEGCVDESAPANPLTAYGRSKLESERLVLEGGYVSHPCVLRLSMVYGPGAKGNLPRMVRAIEKGWFPPLTGVTSERSMVHVEDVVEAAILAATDPRAAGEVYLVTDGRTYSTGEIYAAIRSALGLPPPRWSVPRWMMVLGARTGDLGEKILRRRLPFNVEVFRKLVGSECYDGGKIRVDLGFRPRYSLLATLRDTVGPPGETSR